MSESAAETAGQGHNQARSQPILEGGS